MQAVQTTTYSPERCHPRIPVEWSARIDLGETVIVGTVRDWSEGGYCFAPQGGYIDGRMISGGDSILDEFTRGDLVNVTVTPGYGQTKQTRATVRWCGYSLEHECNAIGVEVYA
jgi:hypothetical protein